MKYDIKQSKDQIKIHVQDVKMVLDYWEEDLKII
jgi:hypothetical protein